jgi:hypothetical protein
MHGKSWKQHMKAPNLLNLPNFKCWFLDLKMLVFYVGCIWDDKNTLCNGCNLNRMIGFYLESSCNMDNVPFKSCDRSQVSRRCPRRFHAVSKSIQSIPVQPSERAFEGVRAPQCLEASTLKMSRRQSNTVQTLGQASPISTQSWISVDTVW